MASCSRVASTKVRVFALEVGAVGESRGSSRGTVPQPTICSAEEEQGGGSECIKRKCAK